MDKTQREKLLKLVWDFDDGYYHVGKDITEYPDAWCFIVYSLRGPGKTVSGLAYMLAEGKKFLYMKRTKLDVETLCSETQNADYDVDDINPFSPINRIIGSNYAARFIDKKTAFAGFYQCDSDGNAIGAPAGYCLAFNSVKSIKGMNFDFCDYIIFDEFIPQIGEKVNAREGELLLDLLKTAQRDRIQRGLPQIRLLLFANAESIATPVTRTLEVMDDIIELTYSEDTHRYIQERGILLHHIKPHEVAISRAEEDTGLYKAMKGTAWGAKTYEGLFAHNDFTTLKKVNMRGYKCQTSYFYENRRVYIYMNSEGRYYMTYSKDNKCKEVYNLNIEGEAAAFYYEWVGELQVAIIEGMLNVEKYTMYDLITNYKKYFKKF